MGRCRGGHKTRKGADSVDWILYDSHKLTGYPPILIEDRAVLFGEGVNLPTSFYLARYS